MSDIATGIILGFLVARLLDYVMSYFFDTDDYDCSCDAECSCECSCDVEVEEILGASEPVTPAAATAATARKVGTVNGLDAPPAAALAAQQRQLLARTYGPFVSVVGLVAAVFVIWLT